MITSASNPQIKNLIQLQKKAKTRKEQGVFVSEGRKMFEEAKELGEGRVVKAYFSESFCKMKEAESGQGLDAYVGEIPFEIVVDSVFSAAAETMTPQGILTVVRQPEYRLEGILDQKNHRLLLLETIQDPGNLGTIIRTAEGAGVTGILLSRESVDLFNPKVIRSTMGAVFRMPVVYLENFGEGLAKIKGMGIRIYAAHLEGAVEYCSVDYTGDTAILIGNEANGLTEESTALADQAVKIPMKGKVESLNAGIAAGILMYERARQLGFR